MKTLAFIVIALVSMNVSANEAENPNQNRLADMIQTFEDKFASGDIGRVEIINYPSRILTRTRMSPTMLESNYHYKLIIANTSAIQKSDAFLKILKKTKIIERQGELDFRWGFIIYDKNGVKILSLFLDAKCQKALFGELPIILDGPLSDWFSKNFPNCFE